MPHPFRLYGRFLRTYMKTQLEYRFSFFGDIFVNMMTFVTLYLSFWVLFNTFPTMNGWNYWEVVFLYNLNLLTYATSSLFFWGPMKQLEHLVRSGEFDQFLVRPLDPLKLLVFRQFQHTFIGHIIVAGTVMVLCTIQLEIHWTTGNIAFLLLCVLGGTLIQAGIIITAASSAFWVVRSGTVVDISIYAIRNFINYPISIYGRSIQLLLTFVIPYAFVNYYPAAAFFGKDHAGSSELSHLYSYSSLAVGAALFAAAVWIFRRGVMRYDSAGS
ncbi:ABC-2 family transporter protein [Paenibacillus oenotherae]|uniref:ABC-2 family transporter protein n=1 Tax=Paenibacillus oenotherae TaxID=1435645 RepID=A0ABS7D7I1_9BACL|nr:ABC-2 family transporter protein [Paenibacillus oenotherae]MBW7475895.1 ABC-2 family transporter protein [Paenibacillus oenotherae]